MAPTVSCYPPDGADIEYLAVKEDTAYGDFAATCRFKYRDYCSAARLMFRFQDMDRFYALDIPGGNQ